MKNLPNIEKSHMRPHEYIGYADGAWRIRKTSFGGWEAEKFIPMSSIIDENAIKLRAKTLDVLSTRLTHYSNKTAKVFRP